MELGGREELVHPGTQSNLNEDPDTELKPDETEESSPNMTMAQNPDNGFKNPKVESKGPEKPGSDLSDPGISMKEKTKKEFALVSEDSSELSESEGK